jgi:hypothetical protein
MTDPNPELIDIIHKAMKRREAMNDRATPYEIALAITSFLADVWDEGWKAHVHYDREDFGKEMNPYRTGGK